MIEFGKTLREAREAKGYSIGQLAEITRMAPSTVTELENEDFSHIAAPIYGRGFVKLYCEAVGLEAKPLVDEFMAIFNGDREINIRERTVSPAAAPVPPAEPAPQERVPPPEPSAAQQNLFSQNPIPPPEPPAAPETNLEQDNPSLSRYAAPLRYEADSRRMPAVPWRVFALAAAALLVLVAIGFGIRALYRATTGSGEKPVAQTTVANPVERPSAPAPAVARTPQKIPAFYID